MMLVFGGGGQLGTELVLQAGAAKLPCIGLPRQAADITDAAAVDAAIREYRPSLVVNAASYNAVDKAESEPAAAMRVNALGPEILAGACREPDIPLIHLSTNFVFDGALSRPYREDDPVAPLGVYGLSKARGEEAVRRGCRRHLVLRTAWLFGIHGSNFLKTVVRLAGESDEIRMVTDQVGSPTSTADLAQAILIAAEALSRGEARYGTYHVAGTGEASRYDFARAIVAAQEPYTGRAPRVVPIATADYPAAAKRPPYAVLDSTRFFSTFGFRPSPWQVAVKRAVKALFATKATA